MLSRPLIILVLLQACCLCLPHPSNGYSSLRTHLIQNFLDWPQTRADKSPYVVACQFLNAKTHLSLDGHIGYFHILAVVNNAVMNMGVLICLWDLGLSSFRIKERYFWIIKSNIWPNIWVVLPHFDFSSFPLHHSAALPLYSLTVFYTYS